MTELIKITFFKMTGFYISFLKILKNSQILKISKLLLKFLLQE